MYYFLTNDSGKIFATASSEHPLTMVTAEQIPARTEEDDTLGPYERWELQIVEGSPKWTKQPRTLSPADLMGEDAAATVSAMKALPSAVYAAKLAIAGESVETDDQKIRASGLYDDWVPGSYKAGKIYNVGDQTWECFQAYDNATYPDIKPGNPSWFTFNRPLHGRSPETARPFVPVQGSHDMYRAGEYMIYTDGKTYRCKSDTNFSPDDYADAWEVIE